MAGILANLIRSLDSFDWNNLPETYKKIENLLHDLNGKRSLLSKDLGEIDLDELHRKTELSHETSTHYKWFLHRNHKHGYSVWLHEYKNVSLRRAGYAEVPHNHRYWFSSLMLRGGFNHIIYDLVREGRDDDRIKIINKKRTINCYEGFVYTFDNKIIHSLSDIEEPTLTFVIRSRGLAPYSESYDLETKRITRFTPFSARLGEFRKMAKLIK